MEDILDKLKSERLDYTQLGFNSYGLRQPISQDTIYANQYDGQANREKTINSTLFLGNGLVKIDGANKRIIISDGTNDRVLIGYQEGGF